MFVGNAGDNINKILLSLLKVYSEKKSHVCWWHCRLRDFSEFVLLAGQAWKRFLPTVEFLVQMQGGWKQRDSPQPTWYFPRLWLFLNHVVKCDPAMPSEGCHSQAGLSLTSGNRTRHFKYLPPACWVSKACKPLLLHEFSQRVQSAQVTKTIK